MSDQLHELVTRNYYRTTAARSHVPDQRYYATAARGLRRRLMRWLPRNLEARCLDVGCGCGELLYLLECQGYTNTVGVDLCQEELDRARPWVKAELVCADLASYMQSLPSQSVDFITALNMLEHLPKDRLLSVLRESARILRPQGSLVAMVPNAVSPFAGLTRHWDITHEWAFTPNNFRQLAPLAGFADDVEFCECGPVPHGPVSGLRFLLWQIIRVGVATWLLVELGSPKGGVYTMDMLVRLRAR